MTATHTRATPADRVHWRRTTDEQADTTTMEEPDAETEARSHLA